MGKQTVAEQGIRRDQSVKNMTLTGVEEISSFNERKIVVVTEPGQLTITGHSLRILSYSPKTGDMRLYGTIDSLVYADRKKNTIGLWERVKV